MPQLLSNNRDYTQSGICAVNDQSDLDGDFRPLTPLPVIYRIHHFLRVLASMACMYSCAVIGSAMNV
jgi:hypothetical protein